MLKLGPRRRDRSNAGTTGSPRAAGLLRTRPASRGPHAPVVRAAGADDMVEVGKRLKAGDAVVLDLETLPDHLKRRLLDACAGLVYGFDASMTRTASDRYLLERPLLHTKADGHHE
jgi:Cell division protein SepF